MIRLKVSKIKHLGANQQTLITIFHKICYKLRILSVIFKLTVVLNLLALLHSIWIYLNHTDSF